MKGKGCTESVKQAYKLGYRLFDSAKMYGNEKEVGSSFNVTEASQVLLTTKLHPADLGYASAKRAFQDSWELLTHKTRPIDVYLIHWPGPWSSSPSDADKIRKTRRESWKALEELYRQVSDQ